MKKQLVCKTLRNKAGQALLLVTTILLLMLLLSATAIVTVAESRRAYMAEKTMVQACYIAETGVERALAKFREDSDLLWDVLFAAVEHEIVLITGEESAGGIITLVKVRGESFSPSSVDIIITSIGTFENSKKTLVVKAQVKKPLSFTGGIWANRIENELGIWELTGDMPVPVMKKNFCEKNYTTFYVGDLIINGELIIKGLYYVTGDLYLAGFYQGVGAIVAGGGVYIAGDLLKNSGDSGSSLLVVGLGKAGVTVKTGVAVEGLLYSSPGESTDEPGLVHLEDGVLIKGGIICDRLSANPMSGSAVQFDNSLAANQPNWLTTEIVIKSWEELYPVF
ncbi:MAG: hypothetical protein FWD21_05345 [Peptococcaceae bacterium]|nr:hypothetical protein [Peptococcaceae bacterium]